MKKLIQSDTASFWDWFLRSNPDKLRVKGAKKRRRKRKNRREGR